MLLSELHDIYPPANGHGDSSFKVWPGVGDEQEVGVSEAFSGLHGWIRSGSQARTSRQRAKCRIGSVSGSVTPIWAVISSSSTSASASCRGHIRWWMSPRRMHPFSSALYRL